MKVPTYRSCVAGVAMNALTFWRLFPQTLRRFVFAALDVVDTVVGALFHAISLIFVIAAPVFLLLSPITGWFAYCRALRGYDARYAEDREGIDT